jgi:hypothetical protein
MGKRTLGFAAVIFAPCALGGDAPEVDPIREGLLPIGFATHLARTHEIALTSRVTPPGVTFGRTNRALAIGDVNGDGVDDVVMGFAECAFGDCAAQNGATRAGVVRAFSGLTGELLVEIVGPSWTTPSQIDAFGATVALADVTGDGVPDFVIGAPRATQSRGRVDLFDNTGKFLRSVQGPEGADRFASKLLALTDATFDGRDDFAALDTDDAGREPTLWSFDANTGAALFSRTVLSHRVQTFGDRDADGVPEIVSGAPGSAPPELARARRASDGSFAFTYLASEGFVVWLGDIDDDGVDELIQFNTLFESPAPGAFISEGDPGIVLFPPPLLALGALDASADDRLDAAFINGGPLGDPNPLDDELNLTDVRNRVTRARFLPRHRALIGAAWMRHEMRSATFGDVIVTEPANSDDIAIEVYPVNEEGVATKGSDDRFVVAIYAGPWLPGDANADGVVDFADLNLVLGRFNRYSDLDRSGDVNGDAAVDLRDVGVVFDFFGSRAPSIPDRTNP